MTKKFAMIKITSDDLPNPPPVYYLYHYAIRSNRPLLVSLSLSIPTYPLCRFLYRPLSQPFPPHHSTHRGDVRSQSPFGLFLPPPGRRFFTKTFLVGSVSINVLLQH